MLTLKEPVFLTIHAPVSNAMQVFSEKILQNYGMIFHSLTAQDLLHAVMVPPEIYIAMGEQNHLSANSFFSQNQELKLQMINQVVNRILLMEQGQFTYQDMVAVSCTLRKLGIHQEQKFMNQVQQLRMESQNTRALTNLYWEYAGDLKEIIGQVKKDNNEKTKKSGNEPTKDMQEQRYFLQESIFKRLQTAAIYQLLQSFYEPSYAYSQVIHTTELQIAEQGRFAEKTLLQKLKNITLEEKKPLHFFHMNIYEIGEELSDSAVTEQTVLEEMAAAVLLHLVDNIYTLRIEQLKKSEERWYEVTQALYHSCLNTLNRYESYHREFRAIRNQTDNYLGLQNQQAKDEIQLMSQITEHVTLAHSVTVGRQGQLEEEEALLQIKEAILQQRHDYSMTQDHTDIILRENLYKDDTYAQFFREQKQFATIEEQVAYYEQQNLTLREQVNTIYQEGGHVKAVKVDKERARRDSLRALENPQELIQEYIEENTKLLKETKKFENRYESLMSEETKMILNRLEQFYESPNLANRLGIITEQPESLLQTQISELGELVLEYPSEVSEPDVTVLQRQETKVAITNEIYHDVEAHINQRWLRQEAIETYKKQESYDEVTIELIHKLVEAAGEPIVSEEVPLQLAAQIRAIPNILQELGKNMSGGVRLSVEEKIKAAGMIHKYQSQEMDEETIEEMIRLLSKQHKTETTETVVQENNNIQTVNTTTTEMISQNTEQLTQLVQKQLRREMAAISEQVYKKLEQRLYNEKSRRGY